MDIQLSELDLNNIGDWPLTAKMIMVLVLGVAIIGAVWWFDTQYQIVELERTKAKEVELRKDFETKQKKANNLPDYQRQYDEMQENLGSMLKQLPTKTEVDSLLTEVSQTGLATGLEPELFRPGVEKSQQDLFMELPIIIRQVGDFHEFGNFVSQLASLPRIVTIHDITITPRGVAKSGTAGGALVIDATAKTYRYLEGSK